MSVMKHLVLIGLAALMLTGCENKTRSGICGQVNSFLDLDEAEGPLVPLDWGRMTLAGARLTYVVQECGDRVAAPREELCAQLRTSMIAFADSPNVEDGENRSTALNQNRRAYEGAGCTPELDLRW